MNPLKIPKVVAEIGCNHRGDVDTAKQMQGFRTAKINLEDIHE